MKMAFTPIEQAARAEYEYFGSTLTTNTALKVALVILSIVIAVLAVELRRTATAAANMKPLIIRVNEIGRAEAVAYSDFVYKPQAPEIRYFLTQFVTGFYGRIKPTVRERYVNSLYFLDRALFSRIDAQDRRTQWLPKFLTSADEETEISVRNVVIENLQAEPYRARVEYSKIFTSATGVESRRENWTAVFDFRFNAVANDFTLHNPLGLAIVSMRQDQAFTN
jgi:type IV secretory pathway TrbF-like protein